MAREILFSVGRLGGRNLPDDTRTVQELLNQVPVADGGPVPRLDPDGKCGPLTINAIQKFQVKHFGWKGADGRVDPDGPTLDKLNTFDKSSPGPTPPPQPPPPPPLPEADDFFIIHMAQGKIFSGFPQELFFLLADIKNNNLAVYWLDPNQSGKPQVPTPQGNNWSGSGGRFRPKKPRRVNDFQVPAVWMSKEQDGEVKSHLTLFFPADQGGGGVTIPMNHHLIGPGGRISPSKNGGGGSVSTFVSGDFRLIELR